MSEPPPEREQGHGAAILQRDKTHLLGNVSLAVAGQAAAFAAGLGAMIVTVRLLGPEGYGRLAMFFLFLEVLSQIVGWPNLGLVRYGRQELGESGSLSKTFWARLTLFLVSLLAAAALLLAARNPVDSYLNLGYSAFVLLLAYVALNELVFLLRGVFQTVGNFRGYAFASAGVRAFNLLLLLLAFKALGWHASPAGIIGVHLASIAVVFVMCAPFLPRRQLLPMGIDSSSVRRVFRYSWPVILAGLSMLVVNWVDLVVIKHFRSAAEVGLYAVAYQPVTVLTALHAALVGATLPMIMSLAIEKRRGALLWYANEGVPQIAWMIGLGCIVLCAAAEAIPFVLGAQYVDSVTTCQVLIVGFGFYALTALQMAIAQSLDRVIITAWVMLGVAGLNFVLDIWLVPVIGILGAAIATSTSFMLSALCCIPVLHRFPELRGPSAAQRVVTLLGLVPVWWLGILVVFCKEPVKRLGAAAGAVLLWVLFAKTAGVFRAETLDRMHGVRMPEWTLRAIQRFYGLFARRI